MLQTRLIAKILTFMKLRPIKHDRSASHSGKDYIRQAEKDRRMVKQEIADINLVGRNCVLVTDIFKRNINQTIVELEKRHKTRVEAAIYFNSYTGLGEKSCLLLKIRNPLPLKERIQQHRKSKDGHFVDRVNIPLDIVERRYFSQAVLQRCRDVSSQALTLYENVSMSPQVCLYHNMITAWLEDCFKQANQDFGNLMAFGSAPSGLSLHGSSDLDIAFTNFGQYMERDEQRDILRNAGNQFRRMPGISRINYVFSARVPILKFYVLATGLSVDLSVSPGDGIYFTSLFNFLKKHDERIIPVIVCLKYWSKVNLLASIQFSNFVLTTLVLFYLQQMKIVPPLKQFITDSGTLSIDENVTYKGNLNEVPLDELLRGFFQYYSSFSFSTHNVNLLEGATELRTDELSKYNNINIYNPFFPNCYAENIGRNVTTEKMKLFSKLCQNSLMALEYDKLITPVRMEWGLNLILPCKVV